MMAARTALVFAPVMSALQTACAHSHVASGSPLEQPIEASTKEIRDMKIQLERPGLLPPGDLQELDEERLLLDRIPVRVEKNLLPQPMEFGILEVLSLY